MNHSEKNRSIVIINQDSGYLTIDLANTFDSAGYNVSLLAGRLVMRGSSLNDGVLVRKIIKYNRKNYLLRFYSWVVAFVQIVYLIKKEYANSRLLIITNPPLSTLVPMFANNEYSVLIFDYYVNLFDQLLPWSKFSLINLIWKKLHYKTYSKAENLFVLTEGMRLKAKKFSKRSDVKIMELWADAPEVISTLSEADSLSDTLDIDNKFMITYSGNIGVSSGVEHLLQIAEKLLVNTDICFLILGEGMLKEEIERQIKYKGLVNCTLLTWQQPAIYDKILKRTDLAFVSLKDQDSNDSIPSKLFTYIAYSLPVVCVANEFADVSIFINMNSIGKSFSDNQIDAAAEFIVRLRNNEIDGRLFKSNLAELSKKHTKNNAYTIVSSYE